MPWAFPAAEPSSASAWPHTRLPQLGKGLCRGGGEQQGLVLQKLDPPQLAGVAPSSCRPGHVKRGAVARGARPVVRGHGTLAWLHAAPAGGSSTLARGSVPALPRPAVYVPPCHPVPPPPVMLPQPSTSAPLYCKNRDSGWGAGDTPARLALGQPPVGLCGRHWLPELQQLLLQPDQPLLRQVGIVHQPLPARGGGSERGTGRAPPWAVGQQGQMPGLAGWWGAGAGQGATWLAEPHPTPAPC